ncbi:hypothetical protein FRC04_005445, partial [Tulasnella sp. 424]
QAVKRKAEAAKTLEKGNLAKTKEAASPKPANPAEAGLISQDSTDAIKNRAEYGDNTRAHHHHSGEQAVTNADPVTPEVSNHDANPAAPKVFDTDANEFSEDGNPKITLHEAVQASKKSYHDLTVAEEAEAIKEKLAAHHLQREQASKKQYLTHQADVTKKLKWINDEIDLKSEIRHLLTHGLQQIMNEPIKFPWTEFFLKVTEAYLVVLHGWSLCYFTNPSNFKTKDDMEAVRDALLSETCYFAKITQAELHVLKVKQAQCRQKGEKVDDLGVELTGGSAVIKESNADLHGNAQSANSQPSQPPPLSPPPPPIQTFQSVFQAAASFPAGYEDIEPSLWPPSAFSAPIPAHDPSLSSTIPSGNHWSHATPTSTAITPVLPPQSSGATAAKNLVPRKHRWDYGLD